MGISTTDIGNAIGASSHDVGTLCKHSNINKWARYKPVKLDKVIKLTDSDRRSANYGLSAVEITGIVSAEAGTVTTIPSTSEWTYTKPTNRFRMGDFLNDNDLTLTNGYKHSAKCPASGFRNITIYNDEFSNPGTFTFNCKFGDASYEGIGDTSGIQIPLNYLTIISDNPINNGKWRFGLALFVPEAGGYKAYIASHEAAIGTISSTSEIAKMVINMGLSDRFKTALINAFKAGTRTLTAIPFIGYNLLYNTGVPTNKYFYFNAGRSFCMPGGEKITLTLASISSAFNITVAGGYVQYMNAEAGTKNIIMGGISAWAKPKSSYSCKMMLMFDLVYTGDKVINTSQVNIGFGSSRINSTTHTVIEKLNTTNGQWVSSVIRDAGRYRITMQDTFSGGTTRTPIMTMLNGLPVYTGASGTEPILAPAVDFIINGTITTKTGGSTKMRMS